jgi:hypothetical protein
MEEKLFFLVGKLQETGEDWDIIGIFEDEDIARKECKDYFTFYIPITSNVAIRENYPERYFPYYD